MCDTQIRLDSFHQQYATMYEEELNFIFMKYLPYSKDGKTYMKENNIKLKKLGNEKANNLTLNLIPQPFTSIRK